jgi:hypothetical protein
MNSDNLKLSRTTKSASEHSSSKIGIVFIILIILQSYLAPLISIASGTDYNKYVDYLYYHTIASYMIIVLSIIIFSDKGLDVFQDHFSLWIIVLTCFFRANLGGDNEIIYKSILIILGLVLSNFIIRNRKSIKTPSLKSIFVGILWSAGTVVIASLLRVLLDSRHGILPSNLTNYLVNVSEFQLAFVTVIVEAYFRGLLFGFLVMNGCRENAALFVQAILFWGMHYMKFTDPILFFCVIPLLTLSLTLIIKKYKMLYLSIMLHTSNNIFVLWIQLTSATL